MASNTNETEFKRAHKRATAGKAAKNYRKNHGSTPAFPVHTPEADAAAPAQAKKS